MAWEGAFEDPEYMDNYANLSKRIADAMSDFCGNALHICSRVNETPLSLQQINQVIDFEVQSIIQQLEDPEMLDNIRKQALLKSRKK